MTKIEAMIEFLKQYPPLYDLLYVNTVIDTPSLTSLNTVYSDYAIQEYTCGNSEREFIFMIKQIKNYDSSGTSQTNESAFIEVQDFMNWIDEQNEKRNFPNFPENCTIYKIENLQNMPNLSGTSNQGTAEYMFQCRVLYEEVRN